MLLSLELADSLMQSDGVVTVRTCCVLQLCLLDK